MPKKKPAKLPKKKPAKVSKLTPKQERFCQEYVIDLNGTQAAIRAGYSEKTANEQAARLLANVSIKSRISELQEQITTKLEISSERVLAELGKIAFSDIRKLFNENGSLIDIHNLSDEAASALSSVEIFEEFKGRGEEREKIGETKKVKMWDKVAALDKFLRHYGLFKQDNEQSRPIITDLSNLTVEELLALKSINKKIDGSG